MVRFFFAAAALLALAACSGKTQEDADAAKPVAAAAAQPAQKTVFDPQLKALQKAKDMQKTVDDQAKANNKAIEDGGG